MLRELAREIAPLCAAKNRADDGTLVIPSEYREIVTVRR